MLLLHGNNNYHAKEHEYQGTEIVAENTYRAELGLHLYGKSWQETTTGANLVNDTYSFLSQNYAEITIVNPDADFADREWQVNGDTENGNDNTGIAFSVNRTTENIKVKIGETYTVSGYIRGNFNSAKPFRIIAFYTDTTGFEWATLKLVNFKVPEQIAEYTRYSMTFVIKEDFDTNVNRLRVAFSNLGGNYYFTKPMLQRGNTLTDYEPYTGGIPSPNPDYPQPISSIGDSGSVDVMVTGKNLIPTNLAQNGISYNADTKRWDFEALSKYGLANIRIINPNRGSYILPAGQYTLTIIDSQNMLRTGVSDVKNKDDWKALVVINRLSGIFTLTKDTEIGMFVIPEDITQPGYVQIQLERGSTATPYQPYREPQTLTINTPNGLCGIPVDTGGNYTDSTGQQWICDEVDFERGVFVQRVKKSTVKIVETLTPSSDVANRYILPSIFDETYFNGKTRSISDFALFKRWGRPQEITKWVFAVSTKSLYISPPKNTDYTVDTLKSYLTPLLPFEVCGVLAEPIETPLTAEELAAYKAIKSYPHYTRIESAAELGVKLKEY